MISHSKKILIIGPFPPPITGLGLSNKVLYEGLTTRGFLVDFINTEFTAAVTSKQGTFSWDKLSFIFFYFKVFKAYKCDCVYITTGQTFYGVLKYAPFLIFAKIFNKKTIVHLHGNALYSNYLKLNGWKKICFRNTMQLYNQGIVLSKSLRYNLKPFIKEKDIFTEHNFIANDLNVNKDNKDYSEFRIVFLSNLMRDKGINDFLYALKKLDQQGFNYTCKVAGGIPDDNSQILSIMDSLPHVEYLGIVDTPEKQELLNWSNLFCLPTKLPEGQPISIIEALYFGNLIVASNTPGITDLINHTNGSILSIVNADNIANVISKISLEELKLKGRQNIKLYKDQFSQDQFVDRIANLL